MGKKKVVKHMIMGVEPGGIAEEMGVRAGDALLSVNGEPIRDVFDYRYAVQGEAIEILIEKRDGTREILEIEKDEFEDPGLVFESGLMDRPKRCANKCVFCFIDQLPTALRGTLYFKDDDARLSFLQGNYVTLTNMSEADIERVLFYHLSPVNISVHATEPGLRSFIMGNPRAAGLLPILDKFCAAGLSMNFQAVLCKGINDGEHLDRTIEDLSRYMPKGRSLSVVPAGQTRFRQGLYPLEKYDKGDCARIIRQVERWQNTFSERHGSAFVYAADEFYIQAGAEIPAYERYEDFPQIENGVGMLATFAREVDEALTREAYPGGNRTVDLATGTAAFAFMREQAAKVSNRFPNIQINVFAVDNTFFGEDITVSGLLTGADIARALAGADLGGALLIPRNALRAGETVLLDDMELGELGGRLGITAEAVPVNGRDFVRRVLDSGFEG